MQEPLPAGHNRQNEEPHRTWIDWLLLPFPCCVGERENLDNLNVAPGNLEFN